MQLVQKRHQSVLFSQDGMTLIEIMAVLVIVGGLLAILGQQVANQLDKSKVETTKILLGEFKKSLESYNLDCGQYPTTDQGLQALVTNPGPEACSNWGPNPYKKKLDKDAWKTDLVYESDGGTYTLKSLGKDKKPEGEGLGKDLVEQP